MQNIKKMFTKKVQTHFWQNGSGGTKGCLVLSLLSEQMLFGFGFGSTRWVQRLMVLVELSAHGESMVQMVPTGHMIS